MPSSAQTQPPDQHRTRGCTAQNLVWRSALWLALVCNWPLWQRLLDLPEHSGWRGLAFAACFAGGMTGLMGALLSLFAWPRVLKPVLTLWLLSAAASAHFMGSYGIVIDPSMVINVIQTDPGEARDLINSLLLMSLLALAGGPLIWLWRQPLRPQTLPLRLGLNLLGFVAGMALMCARVMVSFAEMA